MKLIRYSRPAHFDPLLSFDSFFENSLRALAPLRRGQYTITSQSTRWYEDDTHYHVRIDLPGVKREELSLEVEDGLLKIGCSANCSQESEANPVCRSEYVLRLPEEIQTGGIEARLADGILEITLPKAEVRKPVKVEIQ